MTNNNDDGARSGTSSTASGAAASAAAEPINEEATLPVSKTDDKSRVLGRDAISLASTTGLRPVHLIRVRPARGASVILDS